MHHISADYIHYGKHAQNADKKPKQDKKTAKRKGLKMRYGQARKLLSENIKLEKIITNTGEELPLTSIKSQDDSLSMKKCDVYIKVLKQDCSTPVKDNNSLDIQEFFPNRCQKGFKCKMLFDIRHDDKNDNDESWIYEYLSKYSKLVENTPQYFMLKIMFYNINKTDLYDNCDEIIETLSEPCADCLKQKWDNITVEKFKSLRSINPNNQGR